MSTAEAKQFSPHLFRSYLATSLKAAGCTDSEIQALCRWQSFDSLRIYALIGPTRYGTLLDMALRADAGNLLLSTMTDQEEIHTVAGIKSPTPTVLHGTREVAPASGTSGVKL